MSDKKSSDSRRKLLKSIAAGSGAVIAGKSLPDSWSKPVVDSIMLPAHAQTSPPIPPASSLSCESTGAPFATHTSPGPDVDISLGSVFLPVIIAVTPAPSAPDNVVHAEAYLGGVLEDEGDFQLLADGTVSFVGNTLTTPGVLEFRFTRQAEQCSLFWNLVLANGVNAANPVAGSYFGKK